MSTKSANAFVTDDICDVPLQEKDIIVEYKELDKKCEELLAKIQKRKNKTVKKRR